MFFFDLFRVLQGQRKEFFCHPTSYIFAKSCAWNGLKNTTMHISGAMLQ